MKVPGVLLKARKKCPGFTGAFYRNRVGVVAHGGYLYFLEIVPGRGRF